MFCCHSKSHIAKVVLFLALAASILTLAFFQDKLIFREKILITSVITSVFLSIYMVLFVCKTSCRRFLEENDLEAAMTPLDKF